MTEVPDQNTVSVLLPEAIALIVVCAVACISRPRLLHHHQLYLPYHHFQAGAFALKRAPSCKTAFVTTVGQDRNTTFAHWEQTVLTVT